MQLTELKTPALLLDLDRLERNLSRMQEKVDRLGASLRPHIKTHKCLEIGRRQKELGAIGLTVSTFPEARLFAEAGFDDITWAFPVPPVYAADAVELAEKITLRVLVDGPEAIDALEREAERRRAKLHVWLKIDSGYHRVGVDPETERAGELVARLNGSGWCEFDGILTHSGHAYDAATADEARDVAEQVRVLMTGFADRMRERGQEIPGVSVGSTPAMASTESLEGVTEVRPGNYVFYDAMQATTGACAASDCAVTVLASVVSHQPGAEHFVVDAGALALSKDPGATHVAATRGMGYVFEGIAPDAGLDPRLWVASLSQEHGKVYGESLQEIEGRFRVGEKIRILEHHSCLTVAQFDEMHVVRGEEVVDRWKVLRER